MKDKKSAREPHESARENVQKSARERLLLPVNLVQKVPVNVKMCPWKFSKIEVHGHFQGSRGKKKTLNYDAPYLTNASVASGRNDDDDDEWMRKKGSLIFLKLCTVVR